VSLDDWILSLHVLAAFAYVAALVLFWMLVVASRRIDVPEATVRMEPMARLGNRAIAVGAVGTLVFGIWLALSKADYRPWDPWILAAIVLWAISIETGRRTGIEYTRALEKAEELQAAGRTGPSAELLAANRTDRGLRLHAATSALALLILVLMIWKPGA
jgi:uncharacterized membrane protein